MKVLLGVTGSVAATLTTKLCKSLNEQITIVLTDNAAKFYYNTGLNIYDKSPEFYNNTNQIPTAIVRNDMEWEERYEKGDDILHIKLAQESDILIIAPVSANTLAKMANGICDNLLTCIIRAWGSKPMILAPAMNTEMWNSPFTAAHLEIIRKVYNVRIVPPVSKMLACGYEGMGAMADIKDIVATKDCVKLLLKCATDIGEKLELN
jgi:phosphopantothenoylcysteine decarboxylase